MILSMAQFNDSMGRSLAGHSSHLSQVPKERSAKVAFARRAVADCAAPAIAMVDRRSERPGLPLTQPQQGGDAHPGTDEDDEREQPHSQTPGEAGLRLENVGGSWRIPGSRPAGPAGGGDRGAKRPSPFQPSGLAGGDPALVVRRRSSAVPASVIPEVDRSRIKAAFGSANVA